MSILNWVLLEVDFLSQFGLVSCMIFCCGRPVNVQVSRFPKMQARTHTHTDTHTCSETSYRITDVERIVRAKNTPVTPDRTWWMTRREKQCKGNLSTSLLDATVPSDEVGRNSDCENRTVI